MVKGHFLIRVENGRVVTSRMPATLLESKEKIQACIKYHDPSTFQAEKAWLVKVHGVWISKLIDAWACEVRLGKALDYSREFVESNSP